MPIRVKKNESKKDFLDRCIPMEIESGMAPDQAVAVCNIKYKEGVLNQMSKVRSGCTCGCGDTHNFSSITPKYQIELEEFFEENVLGISCFDLGLTLEEIDDTQYMFEIDESDHDFVNNYDGSEYFATKPKKVKIEWIPYYKYRIDPRVKVQNPDNSRSFCVKLRNTPDKLYTYEDIRKLDNAPGKADPSGGGGYNVFLYRGGNFCRDVFVKYLYNPVTKKLKKSEDQPFQPKLR